MKEQLDKLEKEAKEIIAKVTASLAEIEVLKSLKPNFEIGKWYGYTNSDVHLVCFTDILTHKGFGFNYK